MKTVFCTKLTLPFIVFDATMKDNAPNVATSASVLTDRDLIFYPKDDDY